MTRPISVLVYRLIVVAVKCDVETYMQQGSSYALPTTVAYQRAKLSVTCRRSRSGLSNARVGEISITLLQEISVARTECFWPTCV